MNALHAHFSHIHLVSVTIGWKWDSADCEAGHQVISIDVLDASARPWCGTSCCTRQVNVANCVLSALVSDTARKTTRSAFEICHLIYKAETWRGPDLCLRPVTGVYRGLGQFR